MIEAGFTRSIHRRLPSSVHAWKISDRFTAGVPDAWYSGKAGDLWVEYKFLQAVPKTHTPKLSPRQRLWLDARHDEGRNVAVIIGTPDGSVIVTDKKWTQRISFTTLLKPQDVANWITKQVATAITAQSPSAVY